jgi:hypothetical protein
MMWGVFLMAQGGVHNFASLAILRVISGAWYVATTRNPGGFGADILDNIDLQGGDSGSCLRTHHWNMVYQERLVYEHLPRVSRC